MGKFTVGTVVLVLFPFSNLKGQKVRPAMVLARVEFDNLILCQITSKPYSSKSAIRLESSDFSEGRLPVVSFVRPNKLFTADATIIKDIAGKVTMKKKQEIVKIVRDIF
ncbi:growth inhibitor PemK [Candidatus Roizmanbacteria bacterium CG_4_10_14_0_2_um_filter_39_12]|nr:MAG: growth inhibitor PemK [Candidatus Roizmanbacteria bacterium CG_4_10_14_0_2_um_filter_39_12]